MELIDYFAAKALPAAIQINKETNDAYAGKGDWVWDKDDYAHIARVAYDIANAMMEERVTR